MKVRTSGLKGFALVALSAFAFAACDEKTPTTVVPNPITVDVTPSTLTLNVGQTGTLVAITNNVPTGQNQGVTWRTSTPSVATVSAAGVVTAVAPGNAVITAVSIADTTKRDAAAVIVNPAGPSGITLTLVPPSAGVQVGSTVQLVAVVNGSPNQTVTYRSSAPGVATVSATGLVTGVTAGTAVITALAAADTINGRGTSVITVSTTPPPVVNITLTPTQASVGVGGTQQFVAQVTGSTNTGVTWRTSNPAIATVSNTGLATGTGQGTAIITAIANADTTKRQQATLTVVGASVAISAVPSSPAAGNFVIQTNVQVPAGTADSLVIRLQGSGGQVFQIRCQTFTAAGAATTVNCPINPNDIDPNTPGAQILPNDTYTIQAVLLRQNQVAATATFGQQLTTTNANTAAFTVTFDNGTDPNSGVDPLGRTWNGGSVVVTVTPVSFTGQAVATMSIGYDRECDGTSESVRTASFNSTTGAFSATFPEGSAVGGSNNGVRDESELGACVRVIDPRTGTGGAVTLSNAVSAPFNLDNLSPTFPGAVMLPSSVPANQFINSGFTFRATGTNAFQNANASDRQQAGATLCPVGGTFASTDECVNRVNVQIFAGLTSNFPTTVNQANLAAFAAGGANVTNQNVQNVPSLTSNVNNAQYQTVLLARDTLGNQVWVAGPTFGVDLTAPTITVTGAANNSTNPTTELTVSVTDDFSGPNTARARITGHSVLEVDTDAGTEVRCYDNAGVASSPPSSGVCPTFDVVLAAGPGTTGVATVNIPTDENFYVIEIVSTDQAGNTSSTTTTRNALVDAEAPTASITTTTVSGTSVSISGEIRDNIDLDAYDLRFLVPGLTAEGATDVGDAVPLVGMTDVESYGLPLVGVSSANGTNSVAIRQIDNTAPYDGTGALVPTRFGFGVFDVAGNNNMAAFSSAAQSAAFTPAAGDGVANLTAFDITSSQTILCATGTTTACGSANTGRTSSTISAIATTPVAAASNPFTTVYFYYVHPGADAAYGTGDDYNVLFSTVPGSSASVQTGVSDRTWTMTTTLNAAGLPVNAALRVFAIGVDAQGDAVISEVDPIDVR